MNPRRTRRRLAALAATAAIVLTAAGCSRTAADPGAGSTSGARSTGTPRQQALSFAACLRASGEPDFPDPDASGSFGDALEGAATVDTTTAAWKQALAACRSLEPAGLLGPSKQTPESRKLRLAFAQCVRDHGVKDFPDPADDAPLIDTNTIPSTATAGGMTILNAATKACKDAAQAAIGATR